MPYIDVHPDQVDFVKKLISEIESMYYTIDRELDDKLVRIFFQTFRGEETESLIYKIGFDAGVSSELPF